MKLKDILNLISMVQTSSRCSPVYACGGVPRDRYMGNLKKISDLDVTTGDKTIDILANDVYDDMRKSFSVMKKTMKDGHSSIYLGSFKIDFSTNFNAENIDVLLKNYNILKPNNLQRETYSRDFTCNSLLLSLDFKKLLDVTKRGMADIDKKLITTCLAPEITLTQDNHGDHKPINAHRIVRSIYLAAKLDFSIDQKIVDFVNKNSGLITSITASNLLKKMKIAFEKDADKTKFYLDKMNLWNCFPLTKDTFSYFKDHVGGEIGTSKAKV